ncbi:hypothetical protein BH11PSE9_BH11PSE9_22040 [soil metagenome]
MHGPICDLFTHQKHCVVCRLTILTSYSKVRQIPITVPAAQASTRSSQRFQSAISSAHTEWPMAYSCHSTG